MEKLENCSQLDRIERNTLLAAKNVLTIDDLELLTGLKKSWIYKQTCYKKIPYYKPNGKTIFFDRKEIEDWMKQNRVDSEMDIDDKVDNYLMAKATKG